MKNLLKSLLICGLIAMISGLMTACTPDMGMDYKGPPVMEVGEPNVISAVKVEIPLNAKAMASVGYKVVEVVDGQQPTAPANAMLLYRTGNKVDLSNKGKRLDKLTLTGNDGLDRDKSFVVYIAAAISDSEFFNDGEIYTVEFTTPDNYADEDVIEKRRTAEGAEIIVQIPERIKQQGRRIKWGVTNIPTINFYGKAPIPQLLHNCESLRPAFLFKNDTTLLINHYNAYRRNENGEIGYYYYDGNTKQGVPVYKECSPTDPKVSTGEAEPIQYYQHFQPGEPIVIMMSEVDYADCMEYYQFESYDEQIDHLKNANCPHKHPIIDWGWGPGWYWYPYDYQAYLAEVEEGRQPGEFPDMGVGGGNNNQPTVDFDKFWHEDAWWRKLEITLPGPELFETGDVKINVSGLTPDGGKITFTPTGDTFAYFLGIYPDQSDMGSSYFDLINMLDGKSEYMQWLTTAEIAPYLAIFPYYESEGIVVLDLERDYYGIQAGMKYHIILNAVPGKMVDGDLAIDVSKQKFQHVTFTLPNYTLDAPELEVTAYEPYSPYKVKFNIKNANPALPVKKVVFAANYTRDFESYMGANEYTYGDIVMANDGYSNLKDAEVEQVNSDFGFDVEFDVRENANFTLAVMGWNMEGRPSEPDKEGSKAVAEAHSTSIPAADALDMEKLNKLKGDWTATATIKTINYNTGATTQSEKKWKVSIGDLDTNKTLTAEEYALLESLGVNKAAADEYLAEFNQQSTDYNAAVLGQNRVLCQGWDLTGERETSTASPWDLFLMTDYNASQVDYLFYDFGPKWFLQTDADGNIFIPVNYNLVPPVMVWYNGMEHYMCSGNYEKGVSDYINPKAPFDVQSVGIPVEISEDGNTVTLKSRVVETLIEDKEESVSLYPNMLYNNSGALYFYTPYVVSEVVLTKGWTEQPATPAPAKMSNYKVGFNKRVANGEYFKAPAKPHSRTVFAPKAEVKTDTKTKVVKYKPITKEEMNKGIEKYLSRFNKGARK